MMVAPSMARDMEPMTERFHRIVKIPSKAATDFERIFGFWDKPGCSFRLSTEDDTSDGPARDSALPFYTIDFSKGGVRLPLDPLFCTFLKQVGLLPTQCAPSLFGVFNGFRQLGYKVLGGVSLGLDDLSHYYRLTKRNKSYTLESRIPGKFLVTHIPEFSGLYRKYVVYVFGNFEVGDKCPRVAGYPICKGVFSRCPSPPHKELLDALLSNSEVDRSVSTLLNFNQIYSRVRQVQVEVITYRDTTEEGSSHSSSDSCSEFDPSLEMSGRGTDMIAERRNKAVSDCEAQLLSQRSRARKSAVSGTDKGKGVSSMTVGAASEAVTVQPVGRATPLKGRKSHSPASYDVEKLARWKPPSDIDEGVRAELGKLPKLPIPREYSRFEVLGTGPKHAHHVVAPYMSFVGDKAKLSSQSSSDIYDFMLESTTDIIAKLSFSAQAMADRDVAVDKSAMESQNEMEKL